MKFHRTLKKQLPKLSAIEQAALTKAIQKFETTAPKDQRALLQPVHSNRFQASNARWTLRASQKYRILVGQEDGDYIAIDFVSRGDHRYYRKE
jgi:mRNA-degrading endonuclease RelE of RelBE toxin-antitoxin system